MRNILARGGIKFLVVFLGIGLSFNVEEWREESQIRERLKGDYYAIQQDLEKDIPYLNQIIEGQIGSKEAGLKLIQMFFQSFFGKFFIIALCWTFSFHILNEARHLAWDMGYGFDLKVSQITGIITIFGSFVLAILIYLFGRNII